MTFANGMLDDVVPFDERFLHFNDSQRAAVRSAAFGVGTIAAWSVSVLAAAWLTVAFVSDPAIKEAAPTALRLSVHKPQMNPAAVSHRALSTAADLWFSAPALGQATLTYGVERPHGSALSHVRPEPKPAPEPLRRPADLVKPAVEPAKRTADVAISTADPGRAAPEPVARPFDLSRHASEGAKSGLEAMERVAEPGVTDSALAPSIPEPVRRPPNLERPAGLKSLSSAPGPITPVKGTAEPTPLPPVRIAPEVLHVAPEVPHAAPPLPASVAPRQTVPANRPLDRRAMRRPPFSGRQSFEVSPQRDDRNPLQRFFDALKQPSGVSFEEARPENPWASGGTVPMEADGRTAVYDIEAHTVYLPDGERLEAHSGLGGKLDDPRSVAEKNRGATPPHMYTLELRRQLFHGVAALRLNPIGGGAMYGRVGLLAHTYMLGPNGQSNGCVSFRDYRRFLNAFTRGEISRLVVVAHLGVQDPRLPWRGRELRTAWR